MTTWSRQTKNGVLTNLNNTNSNMGLFQIPDHRGNSCKEGDVNKDPCSILSSDICDCVLEQGTSAPILNMRAAQWLEMKCTGEVPGVNV